MRPNTVTILAADIKESTPLYVRLGDEAAYHLVRQVLGVLRQGIEVNGGREFNAVGDAILVAFGSLAAAVECAVSMQREIVEFNAQNPEQLMGVGIGLSTGEPIEHEGEYFGSTVNTAARLMGIARAGQILVPDMLKAILASRKGFGWRNLGEQTLRGLGPMRLWEVVWREVATDSSAVEPLPPGESRANEDRAGSTETHMLSILFVDVVDSTPISEQIGDAAYREQSRALDAAMRAAIRAVGGRPVEGKVLGDGVMGVFHSATAGIEAALQCREAASKSELDLHLGLNAGDVIDEGDNVYGWAVNLAARICTASAAGEILVSETVRSLARASVSARFEDRGLHDLKGIEEPQRLYAVRAGL
jgi:class 3 adenylate cyclase